MAPAKRRRRRAGDDVRAARASFVIIAGEPNPSPPLQHVEEQLFFVRGGFFTRAASRSGLGHAVSRRHRDGAFRSTPSRVLAVVRFSAEDWAVSLVSTSVEVCVARERARGPESHRSGRQGCRPLCHAARRCQRCVRARFGRILAACVFGVFLRVMVHFLQPAWRVVLGSCIVCIPLSFGRHALVLTFA